MNIHHVNNFCSNVIGVGHHIILLNQCNSGKAAPSVRCMAAAEVDRCVSQNFTFCAIAWECSLRRWP
jgi:hypothetical protein